MANRSRIFISYSHRDRDRADFLWESLLARGYDVSIDREGILETELITTRIRDMIHEADVIVLVLGPNWLTSPACRQEMQVSLEMNKRVVPAAFEDVGPDLPDEIRDINYVRFYGRNRDWDQALDRLEASLDRDIAWIRDHTRFGEQAGRYLSGIGAPPRGRELRAIRRWIERHPRGAPDPTTDHRPLALFQGRDATAEVAADYRLDPCHGRGLRGAGRGGDCAWKPAMPGIA